MRKINPENIPFQVKDAADILNSPTVARHIKENYKMRLEDIRDFTAATLETYNIKND